MGWLGSAREAAVDATSSVWWRLNLGGICAAGDAGARPSTVATAGQKPQLLHNVTGHDRSGSGFGREQNGEFRSRSLLKLTLRLLHGVAAIDPTSPLKSQFGNPGIRPSSQRAAGDPRPPRSFKCFGSNPENRGRFVAGFGRHQKQMLLRSRRRLGVRQPGSRPYSVYSFHLCVKLGPERLRLFTRNKPHRALERAIVQDDRRVVPPPGHGRSPQPLDHRPHPRPGGLGFLVIDETARVEQAGLAGCIHLFRLASQSDSTHPLCSNPHNMMNL